MLDTLRQRYLAGHLVLFAGAGVAQAGGLPSWSALIRCVLDYARADSPAPESVTLLDRAADLLPRATSSSHLANRRVFLLLLPGRGLSRSIFSKTLQIPLERRPATGLWAGDSGCVVAGDDEGQRLDIVGKLDRPAWNIRAGTGRRPSPSLVRLRDME